MDYFIAVIYLTGGILLLFIGLIVFKEDTQQRINRVTGMLFFFAALAFVTRACGLLIAPDLIEKKLIGRIAVICELFFPQLLFFSFFFPKESPIATQKKLPYVVFAPYIFHLILVLVFTSSDEILFFSSVFESSFFEGFLQPLAIFGKLLLNLFAYLYDTQLALFSLFDLIYVGLSFALMYRKYRQILDRPTNRQTSLVLWGIFIGVGLYAIAFLIPKLFGLDFTSYFPHLLSIIGLALGLYSIAWAIIKYHFLNVRFFIGKSIIFSMGSGILIGCYLLIYKYAKQVFHQLLGFEIPILEIIFLICAAVFFQPILSALERIVKKHFSKDVPDYQYVLQELSHDILAILDIEKLRAKIVKTLITAMSLEKLYLLIESSTGIFTAQPDANQSTPITFDHSNEFIRLMATLEEPVNLSQMLLHLTDEAEVERVKHLQAHLFVPLIHRGELEGVLCLGKKKINTGFTNEDRTLLSILSTQIAIALENSKLYQEKLEKQRIDEEISLAREIQRMLLPQQIPQGKSFKISAINIPSKEVGGDYYDFIQFDQNRVGISIGDISGKGIPGALLMSNLQATFRSLAQMSGDPSKVMKLVNSQITRTTTPEKYATFFYGVFDASQYTFKYSNAGHNFPIIVRSNGSLQVLRESDLIIGIDESATYKQHQVKLAPGDLLICYTDGITEALNIHHVEFGEERFMALIMSETWYSTQHLRDIIYETVSDFASGTHQFDDMTLVILQVR